MARVVAGDLLSLVGRRLKAYLATPQTQEMESPLHDLRAACRSLRCWIRMHRPLLAVSRGSEKALKRMGLLTGQSRDHEVRCCWLRRLRGQRASTRVHCAIDWLLERMAADGIQGAPEPRDLTRVYKRLRRRMEDELATATPNDEPYARYLEQSFEALLVECRRLAAQLGGPADGENAHALRISLKHLRYLVGASAHHLASGRTLLQQLKRWQDRLGDLHDLQMLAADLVDRGAEAIGEEVTRSLRRIVHGARQEEHGRLQPALEALAATLAQRRDRLYRLVQREIVDGGLERLQARLGRALRGASRPEKRR